MPATPTPTTATAPVVPVVPVQAPWSWCIVAASILAVVTLALTLWLIVI